MTAPAMRAFRESGSNCSLTLLTSRAGAAIAPFIREVDEVIEFTAPWMKPAGGGREDDTALIGALENRRFDAAVIFTAYSQSPLPAAYLCHLAGIPLQLAHCRENPYHLLTDWVPEPEPQRWIRHEVRRHLDLASHVGCRTADERLSFAVPARARRSVAAHLRALGLEARAPLIVVPCRFCYKSVCPAGHHACLTRVAPEAVADAAERLLKNETPLLQEASRNLATTLLERGAVFT